MACIAYSQQNIIIVNNNTYFKLQRVHIYRAMKFIDLIAHVFMGVFVVPICIMINRKLYIKIKNEKHLEKGQVIQRIMKTYSLLQCTGWPCFCAFTLIVHLIDVIFEIGRPSWIKNILYVCRFCFVSYRTYLGFNSLIVALSRYVFVVFGRQTDRFGVSKVRALLISCSFGVPILTGVLYEFTQPHETDFLSTFFEEGSISKRNISKHLNTTVAKDIYESPIYTAANTYLPHGLMYTMKISTNILMVLIHSNIIEALLYYHISIYSRRYE